MTKDQVLSELCDILHDDFRVPREKVTPEASFRGALGLDSLDAVDLIYLVGKRFGVRTSIEAFRDLHTVNKVVEHLLAVMAQGGASPPVPDGAVRPTGT